MGPKVGYLILMATIFDPETLEYCGCQNKQSKGKVEAYNVMEHLFGSSLNY